MKIRARLCGGNELLDAAAALGILVVESDAADVLVVDLRDAESVAEAATLPRDVPRVVVAAPSQVQFVTALGHAADAIATSCEPAVLGPMIARASPKTERRATRSILVTGARGGVGRSLLVANVARRLAPARSALIVDATGTAGVASWLRAPSGTWRDLEGLESELTADQVSVVCADAAPGLRILGGAPTAPSTSLCRAAVLAALDLADIVMIDGPNLAEARARHIADLVDRVLVLTYDDPKSLAALDAADLPNAAWLIASQSSSETLGGRDVFRSLPRAEADVAASASDGNTVRGALGKAYDEIAELIAIDAS